MKLVFATHNLNKVKEVRSLLPNNVTLLSLEDIGCKQDIPETALTLEGNAQLKADYITENYGYSCFADDTGLLVTALDGAPGIYSARYAGEQKNTEDNISKLLFELKNQPNRSAHFKTTIALNIKEEKMLFTGVVNGEITIEKSGVEGFGYDSVFKPSGYNKTFAEFTLNEKNKISHRGIAIQKLIAFLKNNTIKS